jgi:hypothetical protein
VISPHLFKGENKMRSLKILWYAWKKNYKKLAELINNDIGYGQNPHMVYTDEVHCYSCYMAMNGFSGFEIDKSSGNRLEWKVIGLKEQERNGYSRCEEKNKGEN